MDAEVLDDASVSDEGSERPSGSGPPNPLLGARDLALAGGPDDPQRAAPTAAELHGIQATPIPWGFPVALLGALFLVGTVLRLGVPSLPSFTRRPSPADAETFTPDATPQELAAALRQHAETPSLDSKFKLGVALANVGRLDEALGFLEEGIRLHSRDLNARYALGVALLRTGDMDRSLAHLRYCMRRHPAYLAMFVGDPHTEGHRSDPRVEAFVRKAFRETMDRWHKGYQ